MTHADSISEVHLQQLQALYPQIAESVKGGLSRQHIIADLVARGIPEPLAVRITDGTIKKVCKDKRRDQRSAAAAEIIGGGGIFLIGLLLSALSSGMTLGSGYVIIFTGMIAFGGGALIRGIVRLLPKK